MTKITEKMPTAATSKPKSQTKASIVEALLERKDGASLEAIGKATGWQSHSSRAFLTGLRNKGRELVRYQDSKGSSLYRLTPLDADEAQA